MKFIITRNIQRITEDKRGATAVEFAIILPVLLLFIFGILEFGLLLFNQHVTTNASREGARAGIVFRPDRVIAGDIIVAVRSYAEQYVVSFGDPAFDVEVKNLDTGNNEGCVQYNDRLQVQAIYHYHFLFLPFAEREIKRTAIMRCE